jgi:hypothetical protein
LARLFAANLASKRVDGRHAIGRIGANGGDCPERRVTWEIPHYLLQSLIKAAEGPNSRLSRALGSDLEGKISPILYLIAIPMAFVLQWISEGIYVLVALMWLIPDRRIEISLKEKGE